MYFYRFEQLQLQLELICFRGCRVAHSKRSKAQLKSIKKNRKSRCIYIYIHIFKFPCLKLRQVKPYFATGGRCGRDWCSNERQDSSWHRLPMEPRAKPGRAEATATAEAANEVPEM